MTAVMPLEEALRSEMLRTALGYGDAERDVTMLVVCGGDRYFDDPRYAEARNRTRALSRRLYDLAGWLPDNDYSSPPVPYRCQLAPAAATP